MLFSQFHKKYISTNYQKGLLMFLTFSLFLCEINCLGQFCLNGPTHFVSVGPESLKPAQIFEGYVRYIFTTLLFASKREHLRNKEKCFLFHFESSFRS